MREGNGFEERRYSSQDGLSLSVRVYGGARADGLAVVCLPGLTRNARDFHDLALHLSSGERPRGVYVFDYRGRGRSDHDRDWRNYDVAVETGDVLAGMTALGIEHAAFVGTSRGGLIIHALAALRPGALRAVVLNDVGPVMEGAGLAQIRAMLQRAPKPRSFEEAARLHKAAGQAAFRALSDADWLRGAHAIYREESGRLVADFDPSLVNTLRSIDLNRPLPVLWPQFTGLTRVPVLAIRGESSKLLSARTLEEMQRRHPRLDAITVPGQGHAPMLDTAGLPQRIRAFIESAERTR